MPILAREIDIFPRNLFESIENGDAEGQWWALYTLSRREKELMRRLHSLSLPFYGPVIPKRSRTPARRCYTVYEPLFRNYVFLHGAEEARYASLTTNCVSRCVPVANNDELTRDLRQFYQLISMGVSLTREAQLYPGQIVRIRAGRFKGFEGKIIRREHQVRLLVAVNFIQCGATMVLEDFEVEPI